MKKWCIWLMIFIPMQVYATPTAQEGYQHAAQTMDMKDLLHLHKQCTWKKIKNKDFCGEIGSAVLKRKFKGDIQEYLKWRGKGP